MKPYASKVPISVVKQALKQDFLLPPLRLDAKEMKALVFATRWLAQQPDGDLGVASADHVAFCVVGGFMQLNHSKAAACVGGRLDYLLCTTTNPRLPETTAAAPTISVYAPQAIALSGFRSGQRQRR